MNARRLTPLVLAVTLGVLGLAGSATPALAAREYVQAGSFGTPCSGTPCGTGQFSEPSGVAVNGGNEPLLQPTAGDVYVIDSGDARVERFSSAGAYLGQFDGAGSYETEGKTLAGPATPSGSFSFSSTADANGIAVDGSEDPLDSSRGDVYVADVGHKVIDKFSAVGSYEGQLSGTCPSPGTCSGAEILPFPGGLDGVAVDPAGHLWVYEGNGNVDEFSSAGAFVQSFNTGRGVEPGFAVDASDNVYLVFASSAAGKFAGGREVAEFDSSVTAITANPTTGEVLTDSGSAIKRFAPIAERAPTPVETLEGLTSSSGLAVAGASTTQTLYVSQRNADDVEMFAAVSFPTTEPASGVHEADATLNGAIVPEGTVTACEFEYGIGQGYGQSVPCEQSPAEINALGKGGTVSVGVSAALASLQARTTYDFRLTVTETSGTRSGKNSTFYTTSRPAIEGESVSFVGTTEATIVAQIVAGGETTGYHIEYGPGEQYELSSPEASIGDPQSPVEVTVRLDGLSPGAAYHVRVVATNALGSVDGDARVFTTHSARTPTALALPDNRVYELVSTPDNTEVYLPNEQRGEADSGSRTFATGEFFGAYYAGYRVAADGDKAAYIGEPPASGVGGTGSLGNGVGNQYVATRGANGWQASGISSTSTTISGENEINDFEDFSTDLSVITFRAAGLVSGAEPQQLAACYDQNYPTIYSRSNGGIHALLTTTLLPEEGKCPILSESIWGISGDDAHILINSFVIKSSGRNLYDDTGAALHQVNVLPAGNLDPNPDAGFGGPTGAKTDFGEEIFNLDGDISTDGSRIFWTDLNREVTAENPTGATRLFVRENDAAPQSPVVGGRCTVAQDACTVQVDVPEPGCASCAGGEGEFWGASEDGAKVFFTDAQRLTADSTAATGQPDLYMYEVGGGVDGVGSLSDLTVDAAGHADVSEVAGVSRDGSYIYFLATGVLTSGSNAEGADPAAGQQNLYVSHDGAVSFITAKVTTPIDFGPAAGGGSFTPAEVAASGQAVAFFSKASLSSYENEGTPELFIYEAGEQRIHCVSCSPIGEPRVSSAERWENEFPVSVPTSENPSALNSGRPAYASRWVNEAGTEVFFNTNQPLVSADHNDRQDVYEWEGDGSGTCTQSGGCVAPISDVEVPHAASLIEADATGQNVFFTQRASLLPSAIDETVKLYDARVDGGFPEARLSCTGTGCQGVPPAPPIFATPASVTFNGVGNFEPAPPAVKSKAKQKAKPKRRATCGRGRVRRHGRCVRTRSKRQARKSSKKSSASQQRKGR